MVRGYKCPGFPGENGGSPKCRINGLGRTYREPMTMCGNCLSSICEKSKKNRDLWEKLYRPYLEGLGDPHWDLTSPESLDKSRREEHSRKRKRSDCKGKAPAPPPDENYKHPKCIQFSLYGGRCSDVLVHCPNMHPLCSLCIGNLDDLTCPSCNKTFDFDTQIAPGEGSTSCAPVRADEEEEEEEEGEHPDCAFCMTDPGTFRLCEEHPICGDCLVNSVKDQGNLKNVKGNSFQCPCTTCPNIVSVTHIAEQLLKAGHPVEIIGKLYVDVQEVIKRQDLSETMKKANEGGETAAVTSALEKLKPVQVFRAVAEATVWRKTPCCNTYFSNDKKACAVVYCNCNKKFCFYCLEVLDLPDPNNGFEEDNPHAHVRKCPKNPYPGRLFPGSGDECVKNYIRFEKEEHEKKLSLWTDAFKDTIPAQEKDALQEAIVEVRKSIEDHAKSEAEKYGIDTTPDEVIVIEDGVIVIE